MVCATTGSAPSKQSSGLPFLMQGSQGLRPLPHLRCPRLHGRHAVPLLGLACDPLTWPPIMGLEGGGTESAPRRVSRGGRGGKVDEKEEEEEGSFDDDDERESLLSDGVRARGFRGGAMSSKLNEP